MEVSDEYLEHNSACSDEIDKEKASFRQGIRRLRQPGFEIGGNPEVMEVTEATGNAPMAALVRPASMTLSRLISTAHAGNIG